MTDLVQLFDGGEDGAVVDWGSSEALGAPVWLAGNGAAVFTSSAAVHGSAAAAITTAEGSTSAPLVLRLPADTTEIAAQAYIRPPTDAERAGSALVVTYLATTSDGLSTVVTGNRALFVQDWNGVLGGGWSDDWVMPGDGSPVRIAWRLKVGAPSTVAFAVFEGESETPLWETTAEVPGVAATDTIENLQIGPDQMSPPAQVTVVVDSIRARLGDGAATAWLPPEEPVAPRRHYVWTRTATGWRNVGTGRVKPD